MTGKEDLFDELEDVLRECSEYSFNCDYEIYNLDSAFNKLKKKLTKYERAFEILKSKEIFEFKDYTNMIFLKPEDYIWNGDIIEEMFINVNEEEYELLEELMKDAKD